MATALIIDDSAIVRNVHSVILESIDFEVTTAENGYEALEKANEGQFDIILVDVNMPRMDGYTLCKKLRKIEKFKETPIIIISTEDNDPDKMSGIKAGANLFLVKPVKAEDLIENVKMLIP